MNSVNIVVGGPYFNLVAWYRLSKGQVCCHVQNHETGEEELRNMDHTDAEDRWNIDY